MPNKFYLELRKIILFFVIISTLISVSSCVPNNEIKVSIFKGKVGLEVSVNQAIFETVGTCSFIPINEPTNAAEFSFRVTFSNAINSNTFTTSDITNTGTGGGTLLVWTISNCGDDKNFKLTASSVVGNGTIIPSLVIGEVKSLTGHSSLASTATDNSIAYIASGWVQEAYIKASNGDASDIFGRSVSLSGDILAVAAFFEDSNQTTITNGSVVASIDNTSAESGAVYIYKRNGENWAQEAYVKASNGRAGQFFGHSVSLSGDTLAVGTWNESSNQTTITNGSGVASSNLSNSNSGAVYIYKRSGLSWTQEAYVKASNNNAGDLFGYSVSLSGDTLAVGASSEMSNEITLTNGSGVASSDNSNSSSGAVYIYKRSGTFWAQEAYVKASNNSPGDNFGNSVSLSGDILAVGAYFEDSNQTTITNSSGVAGLNLSNFNSGAVYIYKRSGVSWAQEAYVKASNNGVSDLFGNSVSLSGDTLAVGAINEDSNQTAITNGAGVAIIDNTSVDSGAVYIYKRSGASWAQEAYVKASNNSAGDKFGNSVSLSGHILAVGASSEDSNQITITNGSVVATSDNSNTGSGAVYIYKRSGAIWAQEAFVKASNNSAGDNFGNAVSLSGDTLAVGAYFEASNQTTITNGSGVVSSDNSSANRGAVYVYRFNTRLSSPVEVFSSATNNSLSIRWSSAGSLALGYRIAYSTGLTPPADCNTGTVVDVGNVLTYNFSGLLSTTHYSFRLCSYDSLGNQSEGYTTIFSTESETPELSSLVISGKLSSKITLNWVSGAGSTAGFKIAYLAGTNGAPANCASGTIVDVGNVSSYELTGLTPSAYYGIRVCSYNSSGALSFGNSINVLTAEPGWVQEAYIKASNGQADDQFGNSISLSGETLAVGAFLEDSNQTTITNGSGDASSNNSTAAAGAVYIYKRSGVSWVQEAYIKASNSGVNDQVGYSVSLSGDTLAAGAHYEDSNQTTITNGSGVASIDNSSAESGAVYIYKRSGTSWGQEAYIKASNRGTSDQFGHSVSVSGNSLAVAALFEDSNQTTITNGSGDASSNNSTSGAGAVYIYKRSGASWAQEAYVKASNNGVNDQFGYSVSLNDDTLAVGAIYEDSNDITITNGSGIVSVDNSNTDSGAVYIYKRSVTSWVQEAYIKASNSEFGDQFGVSVSLNGDSLAVGAINEDSSEIIITNGAVDASFDNSNTDSGAVYIYKRTEASWAQEAYIKASNNDAGDLFGNSISLSGDTLAVGAHFEASYQSTIINGSGVASSDNIYNGSGAVYIYKRSGGNWAQEAYVKASNSGVDDHFGYTVSLSGDTLAVGANLEDSNQTTITNGRGVASSNNTNPDSGAVYVYRNIDRLFEVPEAWTTATSSSITLTWLKSGGTTTSYYYAYQAGVTPPNTCFENTSVNAGSTTTATVTGLTSGTTYSFRLCAFQDGSTISSGIVFSQTTP